MLRTNRSIRITHIGFVTMFVNTPCVKEVSTELPQLSCSYHAKETDKHDFPLSLLQGTLNLTFRATVQPAKKGGSVD